MFALHLLVILQNICCNWSTAKSTNKRGVVLLFVRMFQHWKGHLLVQQFNILRNIGCYICSSGYALFPPVVANGSAPVRLSQFVTLDNIGSCCSSAVDGSPQCSNRRCLRAVAVKGKVSSRKSPKTETKLPLKTHSFLKQATARSLLQPSNSSGTPSDCNRRMCALCYLTCPGWFQFEHSTSQQQHVWLHSLQADSRCVHYVT